MSREALIAIRADAQAASDAVNRILRRIDEALAEGAPFIHDIDPHLIADLKRDEGYAEALPDGRCTAYPDPLSGGDPWTIGYGHTGAEVREGLIWTKEQAEDALLVDVAEHNAELARHLPWVDRLDPARRRVLQNMAFNLGVGRPGGTKGLLGFKNTLGMIERGEFEAAAAGMLKSLWAKQVGQRAVRLANTMRTGQ